MYERYYGLAERPFSLTPDTEFFYRSVTHQEALNVLLVALGSGDGFIKVTGEVGTGKTLLCRKLLDALEADYDTVYVPNPCLNRDALLQALLVELNIDDDAAPELYLERLNRHLIASARDGRGTVIVLDEAQALPEESLETVRLVSNLETGKRKLVQIVLFGQPELDARLAQSGLRQLRQRIMHAYELRPLEPGSVRAYLQHRVRSAGYRGPELFDSSALRRLYQFSRGIPRVINVLSNKAMMLAYASGEFYIRRKHIEAAAADSQIR